MPLPPPFLDSTKLLRIFFVSTRSSHLFPNPITLISFRHCAQSATLTGSFGIFTKVIFFLLLKARILLISYFLNAAYFQYCHKTRIPTHIFESWLAILSILFAPPNSLNLGILPFLSLVFATPSQSRFLDPCRPKQAISFPLRFLFSPCLRNLTSLFDSYSPSLLTFLILFLFFLKWRHLPPFATALDCLGLSPPFLPHPCAFCRHFDYVSDYQAFYVSAPSFFFWASRSWGQIFNLSSLADIYDSGNNNNNNQQCHLGKLLTHPSSPFDLCFFYLID